MTTTMLIVAWCAGLTVAVPQGHPDTVWSGCLERAGLAPGLSSYAQRGAER